MEQLPKYTADLLDMLDEAYPKEPLSLEGMTALDWQSMDDAYLRKLAFYAGQRAVIEELRAMQREQWNEELGEGTGVPPADPFGSVLAPDGSPNRSVASLHLATRSLETGRDGPVFEE